MEFGFIIIAIVVFILNAAGKKKREEQKRAQEEARRRAAQLAAEQEAANRPTERAPYTPPRPTVAPTVAPQQQYRQPQQQYRQPQQQTYRPQAQQQTYMPQQTAQQRPQTAQRPQQTYRPQNQDPRFFDDTARPRAAAQRMGEGESSNPAVTKRTPPHTVRPLTETEHRHMETSATGFVECEPDTADVHAPVAADAPAKGIGLNLGPDSLAAAVLYSEILGKPKAYQAMGGRR